MKKLFLFTLAFLLIFNLFGCAGDHEDAQDVPQSIPIESQNTQDEPQPNMSNQCVGDIELLSCQFADSIHAADSEAMTMLYEKLDGKIYVDLLFSVDNNTAEPIDNSTISGWLTFQDVTTELQYCRNSASATAVNNDPVLPDEYAYVHLFARLPAEAENENLTVHYTVNGQEYECSVYSKDTKDPLSAKTLIKAGDIIEVPHTAYQFEVLSVGKEDHMHASNQTDTYYVGSFALIKLEVTNNHPTRVIGNNDIFAYTDDTDSYSKISVDTENEEGTDFSSDISIAPGESKLVYVYANLSLLDTETPTIRINIAGSCYYAVVK